MADFWSTLEELEAKSGLPSGPGEEGMTSPALEQEKGPAHIGGALKSSAYGLADSFGYIPEGAAEFVPPMLPGGMAAYEGLTKVGKKWHGFIGKMMKESPDVQDWLKSVEEKKEPYLSELLGSLGTTAGGLVVHKIPYIGTALSASMFYGANKSEIYNAAIEQGADLREAELVSSVGSVISTVPDVIGLEGLARTFRGKALARFLVTIGVGKVAQAIASVGMKEVGDVAFGSVLEGTTEGMQQVAQYVAAKWASRPQGETLGQFSDRMLSEKDQILEEAWHAAKIGAGVGLLAAGGGAAYSRFGPQPKPTPEPEPTNPPLALPAHIAVGETGDLSYIAEGLARKAKFEADLKQANEEAMQMKLREWATEEVRIKLANDPQYQSVERQIERLQKNIDLREKSWQHAVERGREIPRRLIDANEGDSSILRSLRQKQDETSNEWHERIVEEMKAEFDIDKRVEELRQEREKKEQELGETPIIEGKPETAEDRMVITPAGEDFVEKATKRVGGLPGVREYAIGIANPIQEAEGGLINVEPDLATSLIEVPGSYSGAREGRTFFDVAGISNSMTPKDVLLTQLRTMILEGQHKTFARFEEMLDDAKDKAYKEAIKAGWSEKSAQRIKGINPRSLAQPKKAFSVGLGKARFSLGEKPQGVPEGVRYDGKWEGVGHAWTDVKEGNERRSFTTEGTSPEEVEAALELIRSPGGGVLKIPSKPLFSFGLSRAEIDNQMAQASLPLDALIGNSTREKVGGMLAKGDEGALSDIEAGVRQHGHLVMQDAVRNEVLYALRMARSLDEKQRIMLNLKKLMPKVDVLISAGIAPGTAQFSLAPSQIPKRTARGQKWHKAASELQKTDDYRKAGFILNDGNMLEIPADESKSDGWMKHIELIGDIVVDDFAGSGSDVVIRFMEETGAVRTYYDIDGQRFNIDIIGKPTEAQYRRLGRTLKEMKEAEDNLVVDVSDNRGQIISSEVMGWPPALGKLAAMVEKSYGSDARFALEREAFPSPQEEAGSIEESRGLAVARATAKQMVGKLPAAPPVKVLAGIWELPEDVGAYLDSERPGWRDDLPQSVIFPTATGYQTYMFYDQLIDKSPEGVMRKVLHELVGHYGLERVFGPSFNSVLDNVWASFATHGDMALIKATYFTTAEAIEVGDEGIAFDSKNVEHRRLAAREFLGMAAEKGTDQSVLSRIYTFVKNLLRSMRIDIKLGDSDIRSMLNISKKYLEQGEAGKIPSMEDVLGMQLSPQFLLAGADKVLGKDSDNAKRAEQLESKGANADDIWAETGLMRTPEGDWAVEIDDSGASWKIPPNQMKKTAHAETHTYKLGDVLDHPELYKHFPEARDVNVRLYDGVIDSSNTLASYHEEDNMISISASMNEKGQRNQDALSDTIHEVEHYLQAVMGWARGGSPSAIDLFQAIPKLKTIYEKRYNISRSARVKLGIEGFVESGAKTNARRKLELVDAFEKIRPELEVINAQLVVLKGKKEAKLALLQRKYDDLGAKFDGVQGQNQENLDMWKQFTSNANIKEVGIDSYRASSSFFQAKSEEFLKQGDALLAERELISDQMVAIRAQDVVLIDELADKITAKTKPFIMLKYDAYDHLVGERVANLASNRRTWSKEQRGAQRPRPEGEGGVLSPKDLLFAYSPGGPISLEKAPWNFSRLSKAVDDVNMPGKVQSLLNWLGRKQVKSVEMDWIGVRQWIKDNAKDGAIDREAFRSFVKANQIEVQEIVKGQMIPSRKEIEALITPEMREGGFYVESDGSLNRRMPNGDIQLIDQIILDNEAEIVPEKYHQDVQSFLDKISPFQETNYFEYMPEGGKEYRELLLVFPKREIQKHDIKYHPKSKEYVVSMGGGYQIAAYDTQEEAEQFVERTKFEPRKTPGNAYQSQHWEEEDVLLHVRFDERVGANGEKVLYIEELQSDWMQDIDKYGVKRELTEEDKKTLQKELWNITKAKDALWDKMHERVKREREGDALTDKALAKNRSKFQDLNTQAHNIQMQLDAGAMNPFRGGAMNPFRGIASAPFTNWEEIGMKRMIRYAAERGFDKVAWSTAEGQIKRWGSDRIMWKNTEGRNKARLEKGASEQELVLGKWTLARQTQFGGQHGALDLQQEAERLAAEGKFEQLHEVPINSLEDVKEFVRGVEEWRGRSEDWTNRRASSIWNKMQSSPESGAYLPRAEGMKAGYDEKLPGLMRKFVGQWKGKVEPGRVGKPWTIKKIQDGKFAVIDNEGRQRGPVFDSEQQARGRMESGILKDDSFQVHEVSITPAMREDAIYRGFPMFSLGKVPANIKQYIGEDEKTLGQVMSNAYNTLKSKEFRDRIRTGIFDKLDPAKRLIGKEPYEMLRLEAGVTGPLVVLMQDGKLEWDQSGKTLTCNTKDEGFVPWLESKGENANKLLHWIMAKRAENLEPEDREHWLDDTARQNIYQWTGGRNNAEFDRGARQLDGFNKSILDLAEHSGLIDPAARQTWEQDYYIPFYRIMEDADAWHDFLKAPNKSKRFISAQIRGLKGAEMKLGDPLENILKNWMHLITESVRNTSRAAAFDLAQANGSGEVEEVEYKDLHVFRRGTGSNKRYIYVTKKDQKNVLSFQRNGKPIYFKVENAELFNALSGLDSNVLDGVLAKMFSVPKRMLTYTATFGPAFKTANLMRDTVTTMLVEKDFKLFDAIKGLKMAWTRSPEMIRFQAAGGAFGSSYIRGGDAKAAAEYISKVTNKDKRFLVLQTFRDALDWWEKVGQVSENACRVGLFAKLEKKGTPLLEAAFRARDLTDFSMSGTSRIVQFLIHTVPFLGARNVGNYKLWRTITGKDTWKNFAFRGSLLALASVALWGKNKDDDRYKALEDWDKWTYYHWWIGDIHIRMPKPFEAGFFFSTVPETILEVASGAEGGKYFVNTLLNAAKNTFAIDLPQAVRPLVEQWANKSFFTGRPIVGEHLQPLMPEEQFDPWSSETLRGVGKLIGFSPAKMEALISGYASVLGMSVLAATDVLVRNVFDFPTSVNYRIDDYPLIGRFLKDADNPRYTGFQSKFYDLFNDYDQIAKTMAHYRNIGDPQKAIELARENRAVVVVGESLKDEKEELRKIRGNMRLLAFSKMDEDEKTKRIDALIARRNVIVKRAYEAADKQLKALKKRQGS